MVKGGSSTSKNPPTKSNLAILDLSSMDSNVNIVQDDDMSWSIDSGAARHVCKSKHWFKTLHNVVDGENLYMGVNSLIENHGKGQVELLFSSGNTLVLRDVYFAPDIRRNLVFGPILNRFGYKLVFEADRCIISKCNLFIGRAYSCCNLFKLSLNCNPKNLICI